MKIKISILFIVLMFSSNELFAGSDGYLEFYKTNKSHKDVISMDIPTFFVSFFLYGEDNKEMRSLLRKTDDFKVFVAEKSAYSLLPVLKKSLHKASYNDAMVVKEDGQIITFKTKGSEELITEIILVVNQVNSFVVVSVRGKFTLEDMREYILAVDAKKFDSGD